MLFEEVTDAQVKRLQNLQQRVEADLVLALLHAGEIGLMDADLLRELHLGQLALTAELADFSSDEFELCGPVHRVCVDFYAIRQYSPAGLQATVTRAVALPSL